LFGQLAVVGAEESADVGEGVFLGRKRATVDE
jgi:hypothetical protein